MEAPKLRQAYQCESQLKPSYNLPLNSIINGNWNNEPVFNYVKICAMDFNLLRFSWISYDSSYIMPFV